MEIYKTEELKKPSLIQKIFGKMPIDNGFLELNNLFAIYQENIEKITSEEIAEIAKKYKIDFQKKYKNRQLELFQSYLHHCLKDSKLEENEIKALKHIKEILFLNEYDISSLIKRETEKLYAKQVKEAVSDGKLDEKEKDNLNKLKRDLLISDEIAKKIYETTASERLKKFIDGVSLDERLSPSEENEIVEIAKNLNIELQIDDKSKQLLEKFKLYWQIENGEIPTISSEISIQKSENLYFKVYVKWLEQRRVTKRINYSGPTARIKLAKGVYYRMGSIGVHSVPEDVWQMVDSGYLYLTNKRLIFMGSKGNKTIQVNKILEINPYKNGVDIQKDSGKSPFIEFSENVDIFSMILIRVMNNQ